MRAPFPQPLTRPSTVVEEVCNICKVPATFSPKRDVPRAGWKPALQLIKPRTKSIRSLCPPSRLSGANPDPGPLSVKIRVIRGETAGPRFRKLWSKLQIGHLRRLSPVRPAFPQPLTRPSTVVEEVCNICKIPAMFSAKRSAGLQTGAAVAPDGSSRGRDVPRRLENQRYSLSSRRPSRFVLSARRPASVVPTRTPVPYP